MSLRSYAFTMAGGKVSSTIGDGGKEVLKWYTRCFVCTHRVRCRNEKVVRGSKKCINLLKHSRKD